MHGIDVYIREKKQICIHSAFMIIFKSNIFSVAR